ncbi:hypothetical protein ACLOJK_021162 [Asimina triloba]
MDSPGDATSNFSDMAEADEWRREKTLMVEADEWRREETLMAEASCGGNADDGGDADGGGDADA